MDKLKPCLKCDSTDVGGAGGKVNCYSCGLMIERLTTREAEMAWNTRPAESHIKAEGIREAAYHVVSLDVGYGVKSKASRDALIEYADKLEKD